MQTPADYSASDTLAVSGEEISIKIYMVAAAAAMLIITTGASAGSHNPAIKDPTVATTQLAAKRRNSFTESQAQGRISEAGYANVSKLMKNNGVWRGTAMEDDAKVMALSTTRATLPPIDPAVHGEHS